jgi:transketolase
VLRDASATPRAVLIATGSEVGLALEAQDLLHARGIGVRVVSMPSTNVFDRQGDDWREAVLPRGLPYVSVEAGVTGFWRQYVGRAGLTIGLDRFGESAPAPALATHFGLTAERIADEVQAWLGRCTRAPAGERRAQEDVTARSARS